MTKLPPGHFRLIHDDKKSAETACLALSRLAESYKNDKSKLKDIAKAGVLANLQKILVTGGGTVSSQTFVTVMHILVVMSSHGSEVGPLLLKENIGPTLRTLLVQEAKMNEGASTSVANSSFSGDLELTQRNPQVSPSFKRQRTMLFHYLFRNCTRSQASSLS